MSRILKAILAINVLVLAILTFAYPHLMVGPGKLIAGHKQLDADCFACHDSFTGASSPKCVSCHKPADIGRLTTTGAPVAKPLTSTPFHQELVSQNCVGCHSDHAGVKRYRLKGYFDHALLRDWQTVPKLPQIPHGCAAQANYGQLCAMPQPEEVDSRDF